MNKIIDCEHTILSNNEQTKIMKNNNKNKNNVKTILKLIYFFL